MNWNAFIDIIYFLIIIGAVADAVLFFFVRKKALEIKDSALQGALTSKATGESVEKKVSYIKKQDFIDASGWLKVYYSLYSNISAAFPLLGILGTVVSLINMTDLESAAASFMSALDTTLWGLICGIITKVADSWLSPHYETALDEADLIIHNPDWVVPEADDQEDSFEAPAEPGKPEPHFFDFSSVFNNDSKDVSDNTPASGKALNTETNENAQSEKTSDSTNG